MIRVVYFFVFIIFYPVFALSEQFSIDRAIESALKNSPLVAEINSSFASSEREAKDISLLPNPEIDAEMQFYSSGAPDATKNQPSIGLTQAFRLSHLGLRGKVSSLKRKAAKLGREAELITLIQKVRLAYGRNWILSERKNLTSKILSNTKEISSFIEKGFRETIFGKGEREIFKAEVARLEAEVEGLNSELSRAKSEMISLVGSDIRSLEFEQPEIKEVDPSLIAKFEDGSFKLQDRMKVLLSVAEEEKRLAERDAFPELRPRLVYAGTNDGGQFYGVGITLPLPLQNRNQNAMKEADTLKQSAKKLATFYRSDAFKSQLLELQQAISSSLKQLELYNKKVIPGFESALKAYNQQLHSGQGTILQVWQTAVSLNDSYERYTELWIKTFTDKTELNILLQEEL